MSDTRKSDAQKSNGQKPDTQKPDTQKPDTQKSNGQKSNGQKLDAQKQDTRKSGAQKSNDQKPDTQQSDSQKLRSELTVGSWTFRSQAQKLSGQKSDSRKSDAQKSDAQKPGTRRSAQISGTQQSNTQQSDAQKLRSEATVGSRMLRSHAQKSDTQQSDTQQSDTQQSDTQQLDHSWFKSPEVFVPQWVLGYAKETIFLYRWSWFHHEKLKTWRFTEESRFQILSFETSVVERNKSEILSFHIGISILDIDRLGDALAKPPPDPDVNLATSVVESHHWVVGGAEPSPELENSFRFGRMRYVPTVLEFRKQITDIVEDRNFIHISHGPDDGIFKMLRTYGVHFETLNSIDTERAMREILDIRGDNVPSKDDLIQEFGVECKDPRLAGNAAHFNLRILLMLIYRDVDRHPHRVGVPMKRWSLLLKRIVNSPPKKRKLSRKMRSPSDSAEQLKNTSIASWVKSLQ
ncbi:cell surface [Fusarium coicis]|nr:cell surface [Fusarium coicis]